MSHAHHQNVCPPASIAVDLGAGSGRVVHGQIAHGQWKLTELGRFATPMGHDAKLDYDYWDLDAIADAIALSLTKANDLEKPTSLGVDSWGVDYVLLDGDFRRVGVPVCYRDKRTAGTMDWVESRIAREEIYCRTGIQFLCFNTLYQLAATVMQEPQWMDAAQHLLMIPDYLHFLFCGVLSNEYTNATTTQMLGLDGEWDTVLMNAIGLKKAITRMPVPAGTVLGDGTGIASGMKIIAPATHDTASAVAGTPLENQNEAYICSGTWSLMGIESLAPIATAAALVMNFTNEGGFEKRFRVLKNIAGMWPIQRICEEHAGADVEALVRQAELAQPWRSVVDLGDPAFLNPASMSDSIRGYCRDTSQPVPETVAQMARCVFDSLALSYRKCKEQLEQFLGRKISTIRIVGGGCQNRLLNQLCADACECPVIAGPVEASVLGNLSAQMIALGILEDLDAARSVTRHSFVSEAYRPKASVPHAAMSRFEELLSMHEPRERQTHD